MLSKIDVILEQSNEIRFVIFHCPTHIGVGVEKRHLHT